MHRTTIGILALSALAASGCGGAGKTFADKPGPATPINVTVYVNDVRVALSPADVGAGPVTLIVTNQASRAESLAISASGVSHSFASTAPINPQATTELTVNFKPGDYTIATGSQGSTDASLANPPPLQPASLRIGAARPRSNNLLLAP